MQMFIQDIIEAYRGLDRVKELVAWVFNFHKMGKDVLLNWPYSWRLTLLQVYTA